MGAEALHRWKIRPRLAGDILASWETRALEWNEKYFPSPVSLEEVELALIDEYRHDPAGLIRELQNNRDIFAQILSKHFGQPTLYPPNAASSHNHTVRT